MTAETFDVAIIGYGPTGLVLANLLGRAGHKCVVIERWPELYKLPRAGHVDGEIMRLLQKIGIAEEVANNSAVMRDTVIYDIHGDIVLQMPEELCDQGWSAHYSMFQPEVEVFLDRGVRTSGSVRVLQGWAVQDIEDCGDFAKLGIALGTADGPNWVASGSTAEIKAHWVIGADGAGSIVRCHLGTRMEDFGYQSRALVVFAEPFDNSIRAHMPDAAVGTQIERPYVAFRESGKRYSRWEFHLHEGETTAEMNAPEKAWELIAPWGFTPENSRLIRNTVYEFKTLVGKDWRSGNFLLAGDAAHLMPPHQGQGMCSGIRDAAALSWRLDLILRGVADSSLLDSYTPERKPHVSVLTRNSAERAQQFWITDADAARKRDEQLHMLALGENIRSNYGSVPPLISGVIAQDHDGRETLAGTLSPQFAVRHQASVALLDEHVGFNWSLLTFDPALMSSLDDQRDLLSGLRVKSFLIEADGPKAEYGDVDGRYALWFEQHDIRAMLIRPDSYIYGVANSPIELKQLFASLSRQLCLRDLSLAA